MYQQTNFEKKNNTYSCRSAQVVCSKTVWYYNNTLQVTQICHLSLPICVVKVFITWKFLLKVLTSKKIEKELLFYLPSDFNKTTFVSLWYDSNHLQCISNNKLLVWWYYRERVNRETPLDKERNKWNSFAHKTHVIQVAPDRCGIFGANTEQENSDIRCTGWFYTYIISAENGCDKDM